MKVPVTNAIRGGASPVHGAEMRKIAESLSLYRLRELP